MAKRSKPKRKTRTSRGRPARTRRPAPSPPPETAKGGGLPSGRLLLGALLLVVAAASSFMLVLYHLRAIDLPGCGPESACARAANSVWGTIPGLAWPTSHVGLAYFLGVLILWLGSRTGFTIGFRWLVRVGAAISLALVLVMAVGGYACVYCLAVHLANLAFLALVEVAARAAPRRPGWSVVPFSATFLVATLALLAVQSQRLTAATERAERELDESTNEMIRRSADASPATNDGQGTRTGSGEETTPASAAGPFTGRYRVGREDAPIRIVIISDYQCPDCKRIEEDLRSVLATRDDVSFSAKHFPFCSDCNRFAADRNMNPHPNACWAARAAEAAGIIAGAEGFMRMHQWLFDRGGSFTDGELAAGLIELGFDRAEFEAIMQGPETLHRVHTDIEEAMDLGLHTTPLIFINGVELRGWRLRYPITTAVERLAATNPPPALPINDQPPRALEKYVTDWHEEIPRQLPVDTIDWSQGPEDAPVHVVVWGDYQEPFTSELDARMRRAVGEMPDLRYSFRHYPIDQTCNPKARTTMHPQACRAAQAAEAAGMLGGVDAYWAMHEWLMTNQQRFNDGTLRAAALNIGLDPETLLAEMDSEAVASAIEEDALAAWQNGLKGVPFVWVNGKRVPRWRLAGHDVVGRILADALTAATQTPPDAGP